jgi:hypothetical protein
MFSLIPAGFGVLKSLTSKATIPRVFALMTLLAGLVGTPPTATGQAPVAAIRGTVADPTGAPIPNARVVVQLVGTGLDRTVESQEDGFFGVENLEPGTYEVEAARQGFRTEARRVTVSVGDNQTLAFVLQPGLPDERVTVESETSGVNAIDHGVHGSVSRVEIESLPLNGRNFLALAQLEPGVSVTSVSNPGGLGNNYHRVAVAGTFYSQTRISVDGSTINDRLTGGTMQNFSQESVREFQISTFNLDPATSTTGAGAINIVTRRGENDVHGSAFFFYRDHNLAAFPALRRNPALPNPFFARRQSGFMASGPVIRDRLFWFASYEHNNQDGVFAVANAHPIFSALDVVHPNPFDADQFNGRLDAQPSDEHQAFFRVSVDDNGTVAPAAVIGMPSNWQSSRSQAYQLQAGIVSVLTPQIVNDLRISYGYLANHIEYPPPANCGDPVACIGLGAPNILVFDAPRFGIGQQFFTPFSRWQRTYQLVDAVTWLRGGHRLRFGGEWEHTYLKAQLYFLEPAQVVLWGPTNLQAPPYQDLYDALPASLKDPSAGPPTLEDILRLPLRGFTTGIGESLLPGSYNFGDASRHDRARFHFQDSWRLHSALTLTYGLAYSFETNALHHDLDRPSYLAPLLGGDLRPPRRDLNNFDPSLGFAWSLGKEAKTVVRAGAGVYHDENIFGYNLRERAFVGPAGSGRVPVDGSVVGLSFLAGPTSFSGQDLLPLLPNLRSTIAARLGDGTDSSVRGVEVVKQGDQIADPNAATAYSIHVTAGIERELMPNLLVSADYVMRRYLHLGASQGVYSIDRNRFNRPRVTGVNQQTGEVSFVRDPVIPLCTPAQARALDPRDRCSAGPINVYASGASYRYQGLHMQLEKRFSSGLQFSIGYALSNNTGFVEFTDFDDFADAYGHTATHRRHRLVASGVWQLPNYDGSARALRGLARGWSLSFVSQSLSAPPLNTILVGQDLDGDGISRTLLPGTDHNSFGAGLGESDIRELVERYNADVEARTRRVTNPDGSVSVIRPRTPFNQIVNPITLPATFSNGDSFLTHDARVTRKIPIGERATLALVGEVFNLFNIANLTGYSDVLNLPGYGQPSERAAQVFGTGGSRSFQLAARLTF